MWIKAISAFLVACAVQGLDIAGFGSQIIGSGLNDRISRILNGVGGYRGGSEKYDTGRLGKSKRYSPSQSSRGKKIGIDRHDDFDIENKVGRNGFKRDRFGGDDFGYGDDDFRRGGRYGRRNKFGRERDWFARKDHFDRRGEKFGFPGRKFGRRNNFGMEGNKFGFKNNDYGSGDVFGGYDSGFGRRRHDGFDESYDGFGDDRVHIGGRRSPKGRRSRQRVNNSRKMEEHQIKTERHCDNHKRCVKRTVETVVEE